MSNASGISPTDPLDEAAKGRVALWLEPKHIQLIVAQSQCLPTDLDEKTQTDWGIIRFRANAALHKGGFKNGES